MPRKNRRQRSRRGRNGGSNVRRNGSVNLFKAQQEYFTKTVVLRFSCESNMKASISAQNISQLYGISLASPFTTAGGIIGAFKVVKIRMMDNLGNEIFLTWRGSQVAGSNFSSDQSFSSIGTPGASSSVLLLKPPKGTAASFWNGGPTFSSTQVLFDLIGIAGSTFLDLTLKIRLADLLTIFSPTSAPSAAGIYTYPLDGVGGSPKYPSVSLFQGQ
jgi:hypothetical protein